MVKVIHEKCDPKLAEDRKLPIQHILLSMLIRKMEKIKSSMILHYVRNKQRCLIITMTNIKQD